MTNAKLLRQKIKASELSSTAVAAAQGWSMPTYYHSISGKRECKATEIMTFVRLLRLTREERDAIFFS